MFCPHGNLSNGPLDNFLPPRSHGQAAAKLRM